MKGKGKAQSKGRDTVFVQLWAPISSRNERKGKGKAKTPYSSNYGLLFLHGMKGKGKGKAKSKSVAT